MKLIVALFIFIIGCPGFLVGMFWTAFSSGMDAGRVFLASILKEMEEDIK